MNELINCKWLEIKVNEYLADISDENFYDKNKRNLYSHISVGAQSSSHQLFFRLKTLVKNHLTPMEIFKSAFPQSDSNIDLSVISFVFHFNKEIVLENSKAQLQPSYSWYENRYKFDKIIEPFSNYIRSLFENNKVALPYKNDLYAVTTTERIMVSNWSERHIAYACGLGAFGMHGALITNNGCTHRLLSVITDYRFKEYATPQRDPFANCLFFRDQSCGECIKKCPVNAIIPGKHLLEKCYDHEMVANKKKSREIFGEEVAACGLCMSGVPCSFKNPTM